jgi:hypothetical protein
MSVDGCWYAVDTGDRIVRLVFFKMPADLPAGALVCTEPEDDPFDDPEALVGFVREGDEAFWSWEEGRGEVTLADCEPELVEQIARVRILVDATQVDVLEAKHFRSVPRTEARARSKVSPPPAPRREASEGEGLDSPVALLEALRSASVGASSAPPPADGPTGLRAFHLERAVPLLAPDRLGRARSMAELYSEPAVVEAFVAHMAAHFQTLDATTQAILRARHDIDDTRFLSADELAAQLKLPARDVLLKEQAAFASMKAAAKVFRGRHPLR